MDAKEETSGKDRTDDCGRDDDAGNVRRSRITRTHAD